MSLPGLSPFSTALLQPLAPNLRLMLDLFAQLCHSILWGPRPLTCVPALSPNHLSVLFISVPSSTHDNPNPFFPDSDTLAPAWSLCSEPSQMCPLFLPSPYSMGVVSDRGKAGMEKEEDMSHVVSDLLLSPTTSQSSCDGRSHCGLKKLL